MIIATAGHVDHGKTSLVRNLTGIETDRLAEEQRRGLSINLGYAYTQLTDQVSLGFIDVPGHKRFINTMISGVSGIDLGMLVVAADDGVMPQTLEHLQVMDLLGVNHFLLIVSKCDRVDEQRVNDVKRNALALLPSDTKAFTISNTTGEGIEALRKQLEARAMQSAARASHGCFRMSIDRAFNLQGQGLVLTGTAASGTTNTNDTLLLQPHNKPVRVRAIRAQDVDTQSAQSGERCAFNVSKSGTHSVHKDDIERGDWLVADSTVPVTQRLDTKVRLLAEAPFSLKRLSNVKLHIGAKRLSAQLIVLGSADSRLKPGETAFAQLVTETPIVCCYGDRFILRDAGETATLGGGIVLDPSGVKYRKSSDSRLALLAAMEHADHVEAIRQTLKTNNPVLDYTAFLRARNIKIAHGESPGASLPDVSRITINDIELWLPTPYWQAIKEQVCIALAELHKKFASEPGVKPALLQKESLPSEQRRFFQNATIELLKEGRLLMTNGLLRLKEHAPNAKLQSTPEWQSVSRCLEHHKQTIPSVSQIQQHTELAPKILQSALQLAVRNGQLIKLNNKRFALLSTVRLYAQGVQEVASKNGELSVIQYRDHMGCGRNLAIEVLEYFDSIRFTQRRGESRIILNPEVPETLLGA